MGFGWFATGRRLVLNLTGPNLMVFRSISFQGSLWFRLSLYFNTQLKPVAFGTRLEEKLAKPVTFCQDCVGPEAGGTCLAGTAVKGSFAVVLLGLK